MTEREIRPPSRLAVPGGSSPSSCRERSPRASFWLPKRGSFFPYGLAIIVPESGFGWFGLPGVSKSSNPKPGPG